MMMMVVTCNMYCIVDKYLQTLTYYVHCVPVIVHHQSSNIEQQPRRICAIANDAKTTNTNNYNYKTNNSNNRESRSATLILRTQQQFIDAAIV